MRRLLLLAVLLVPAAPAAAAPPAVPPGAVAQVGPGRTITRAEFDHWTAIAAASAAAQDDPDRTDPGPVPAEGTKAWRGLADQALAFLISSGWITGEAADRGVVVTDAQVDKAFAKTKRESYPSEADYRAFLRQSGLTEDDLRLRVRLDELSNALRAQATRGAGTSTRAERLRYYEAHRAGLAQPELRDLRIVLAKSRARARAARRALESGRSWKAVARKYSVDGASRRNGGVLLAVGRGQQEKALDDAVFAAPRGALVGPVETRFGFYLFTVTKVRPSMPPSFAKSERVIGRLLASRKEQAALDAFVKGFRAKWKAMTGCTLPAGLTQDDCG